MIPIAFDRDLFERGGVFQPVGIDLRQRSMVLIVGPTGTGKTHTTRYLLANMAKAMPDVRITIIDVKMYDFYPDFFDCPRCHGIDTALKGIKEFYSEFNERVRIGRVDSEMPRRVLLIDEYAAFAAMAAFEKKPDRKASSDDEDGNISIKEAMAIVARLLMTGRAYAQTLIVGCQRAQSDLFYGGSRDNFANIIHMGNFSKEQRLMLASEYTDEILSDCGQGQGYLLQSGKAPRRIIVPRYDVERANALIRGALQY